MTGAIIGGKSVQQAARLQSEFSSAFAFRAKLFHSDHHVQCVSILYCVLSQADLTPSLVVISASSALSVLVALFFACLTLVDHRDRVRTDRLTTDKPTLYRWRDAVARSIWTRIQGSWGSRGDARGTTERTGLLSGA